MGMIANRDANGAAAVAFIVAPLPKRVFGDYHFLRFVIRMKAMNFLTPWRRHVVGNLAAACL